MHVRIIKTVSDRHSQPLMVDRQQTQTTEFAKNDNRLVELDVPIISTTHKSLSACAPHLAHVEFEVSLINSRIVCLQSSGRHDLSDCWRDWSFITDWSIRAQPHITSQTHSDCTLAMHTPPALESSLFSHMHRPNDDEPSRPRFANLNNIVSQWWHEHDSRGASCVCWTAFPMVANNEPCAAENTWRAREWERRLTWLAASRLSRACGQHKMFGWTVCSERYPTSYVCGIEGVRDRVWGILKSFLFCLVVLVSALFVDAMSY